MKMKVGDTPSGKVEPDRVSWAIDTHHSPIQNRLDEALSVT